MRKKNRKKQAAAVVTATALWLGSAAPWSGGMAAAEAMQYETANAVQAAQTGTVAPQSESNDTLPFGWDFKIPDVWVEFEDMYIHLPAYPVLVNNTAMVPARSMLEGLGFRLQWDAAEGKLTASRPVGPTFSLWLGKRDMEVNGVKTENLSETPYIEDGMLWIPLRAAAETSGLEVKWNASGRQILVRDPKALPTFSVGTRADNGTTEVSERLEQYINLEMKALVRFNLMRPQNFNERINVMIAAGEPTDLMLLGRPYSYNNELFTSFASDLTDLLERFPRLKSLMESSTASARVINGHIYGIPRPADPHDASFPAIRQDWLDKLGMETPKTMDELYQVLYRFTKYDPDGNGKDDTYGLTGRIDGNGLSTLDWVEQAYTGSPGRFTVKAGEVLDSAIGSGERSALEWLARAYADGILDKEFAVLSDDNVEQRLKGNGVGLAAMTVAQAAELTTESGASTWVPLPSLQSDAVGPIAPWSKDGAGMYIIPRTVSTDKAVKILEWLDRGLQMAENGDWNRVPGLEEADRAALTNVFGRHGALSDSELNDKLPDPIRVRYTDAMAQWANVSYDGMTLPEAELILRDEKYIDLNTKLEQLKIKVIMGAATLEDWDAQIKELKENATYKSMMKDLNDLLP